MLRLKSAADRAAREVRAVTGKASSNWTIVVLLVLGIASLIVRQNLNLEASDNDFLLKYKVEFHARKPDARTPMVNPDIRVLASIPVETRTCKVVRHDFTGADVEEVRYRIHTAESRKNFVLRALTSGPISCEVGFRLRLDPDGAWNVARAAADSAIAPAISLTAKG